MTLLAWIVGILTGSVVIKFWPVLRKMEWYYWVFLIIWYAFGVFTTAFAQTSFAEGEPQAGWMAVGVFGGIFIILGIVIYIFGIHKNIAKITQKTISIQK